MTRTEFEEKSFEEAKWYEYDYCMGTLQTPSAITRKAVNR